MLLIVFNCFNGQAPFYVTDMLAEYTPEKSLRSWSKGLLAVPRINSKSAQGTFSYHGPTLWNSLLQQLCSAAAVSTFKSKIKTYLFFFFTTTFSFLILHYLHILHDSIVSYTYVHIYAYPFLCAWTCNSVLPLVLYDAPLFLIWSTLSLHRYGMCCINKFDSIWSFSSIQLSGAISARIKIHQTHTERGSEGGSVFMFAYLSQGSRACDHLGCYWLLSQQVWAACVCVCIRVCLWTWASYLPEGVRVKKGDKNRGCT